MSNTEKGGSNSLGGVVGDINSSIAGDVVKGGHGGNVDIDSSISGGKGGTTTIEFTETIGSGTLPAGKHGCTHHSLSFDNSLRV